MSKYLDWLIPGIIVILVWGAEFQFIVRGVFAPLPLSAGISLLLLVRIIHQHAPRILGPVRRKTKADR